MFALGMEGKLAEQIGGRYGRLDCLVNNAGVARVSTIEDNSLEDWRRLMAVNVDSMLLSLRALLQLLRTSGETGREARRWSISRPSAGSVARH
ncbi:SDR family oxidoreductase [Rhizorhabdus argentea]|uniref:SDR family oxidoreductase n=1 Tax=Rhizorhabdus argentea TaxID=1387174 RepID=UPI0030EB1250